MKKSHPLISSKRESKLLLSNFFRIGRQPLLPETNQIIFNEDYEKVRRESSGFFAVLADEIIFHIVSYLSFYDVFHFALTCKEIQTFIYALTFNVYFKNTNFSGIYSDLIDNQEFTNVLVLPYQHYVKKIMLDKKKREELLTKNSCSFWYFDGSEKGCSAILCLAVKLGVFVWIVTTLICLAGSIAFSDRSVASIVKSLFLGIIILGPAIGFIVFGGAITIGCFINSAMCIADEIRLCHQSSVKTQISEIKKEVTQIEEDLNVTYSISMNV